MIHEYCTDISNILVIGSGGAGLRAAIEAKSEGLSVKIIGKRSKYDAHTVLAAGGINAAFGNIDLEDSWEQHFADTYIEGYGLGDPELIKTMAIQSPSIVEEVDKWGANFAKLQDGKLDQRFFGAHTFRRTCYSGDYTGQSILNALLTQAKRLNIPIYDSQYVSDLLNKDGICFGAMSLNTKTGERTIHLADAVILCTGGHTRIWKKSSSRKHENTGDGYHLALKSGCKLIDMEMVQFHPTGMVIPEEMAGTLVTEAVRGEGGKLLNNNKERFMVNYDKERMELSTRDQVAIANYTEIIEGRATKNGGVFLDISHKSKDFILKKIPKIYRQFLETQMVDITKEPMEVAPTAHYTMGGIKINPLDHSTNIKGLFAAGEVAGGLHGANRLGGNSLAEILVFGKQAGKAASSYSKSLKAQMRSKSIIDKAYENLSKRLTKGDELAINLQNELCQVMWDYCGVIRDEESLLKGIKNIDELKTRSKKVDVRTEDNNFQDLVNSLNLESSLITAKATILSALKRQESRGAHQRSDFIKLNSKENRNYQVELKNKSLEISAIDLKQLSEKLKIIVKNTNPISSFQGKLIE